MARIKRCSVNELKFVNGILAGMGNAESYKKAYKDTCKSDASARSGGYRLTHKVPHVMEEISKRKQELTAKGDYDFDKAMVELNNAMDFARSTNNATALVRAVELRSKLSGVLIERVDQRQVASFNLHISGIDDDEPVNEPINITPEPTNPIDGLFE